MRPFSAGVLLSLALSCLAAAGIGQPEPPKASPADNGPIFIRMTTSKGDLVLELNREKAPVTVANFLKYTDRGAYDGTIFHRIVKDFVIQGGGWTPELRDRAKLDAAAGKADAPIKNEWTNGLKNRRGSIAMAREAEPDTATREFYINCQDNAKLDTAREKTGNAGYAVFGQVIAGLGVMDAIRVLPTQPKTVEGVTDGSMENVPMETVLIVKVERITKADADRAVRDSTPGQKPHQKDGQ